MSGTKKGTVVSVWWVRQSKNNDRNLAGVQSLLRPEKKGTVVCLAGARSLL
jgi:hypothetical protein